MTFRKCKNEGCEIQIEVRNTAEGWRPFEESGNMHQCQHSEYAKKQRAQEKNNHGSELEEYYTKQKQQLEDLGKKEGYVDHTQVAKEEWKHKTITDPTPEGFDLKINNFGKEHKIRASQYHPQASLYTISIWYEEIPLKQ